MCVHPVPKPSCSRIRCSRRAIKLVLVALAGCGRIGFDPLGGVGFQRTISVTNGATNHLPSGYATRVALDATVTPARADLADMQVLRGDGTQIDRIIDTSPADGSLKALWFALAADIAPAATDSQYTLTYGDPNADTALADGAHIFPLYDDFTSSQLSPIWLVQGSPQLANGELTILHGTNGDGIGTMPDTNGIPLYASVDLKVRVTDPQSMPGAYYYWFGFQTPFVPSAPFTNWVSRQAGTIQGEHAMTTPPCDTTYCPTPATPNPGTGYRLFRIDRVPTQQTFWIDGELYAGDTQPTTDDTGIEIRNFLQTGDLVVDWIRAKAAIDPEPTTALGPERPR
jgi:hypothetical protein